MSSNLHTEGARGGDVSEKVYLLWFHSESDKDEENGLLIGIYESEPAAQAAIERLRNKVGFVDYPRGFQIHERELGRDYWTEGFVVDD